MEALEACKHDKFKPVREVVVEVQRVYESLGSLQFPSAPPTRMTPSPGPRSGSIRSSPSPFDGPKGLSRSQSLRIKEKPKRERTIEAHKSISSPTTPTHSEPTSPTRRRRKPQLVRRESTIGITRNRSNTLDVAELQNHLKDNPSKPEIDKEMEIKIQRRIREQIQKAKETEKPRAIVEHKLQSEEEEEPKKEIRVENNQKQANNKQKDQDNYQNGKEKSARQLTKSLNIEIPTRDMDNNIDRKLQVQQPVVVAKSPEKTVDSPEINTLKQQFERLLTVVGQIAEDNRNNWKQMDSRLQMLEDLVSDGRTSNKKRAE